MSDKLKQLEPHQALIINKICDNISYKLTRGKLKQAENSKDKTFWQNCKEVWDKTDFKDMLPLLMEICKLPDDVSKVDFDGEYPFTPDGLKQAPKDKGIYMLFDKGGNVTYIGTAKGEEGLAQRHSGYAKGNIHNEDLQKAFKGGKCTMKYCKIDSEEMCDATEAYWINKVGKDKLFNKREELGEKTEKKHIEKCLKNILDKKKEQFKNAVEQVKRKQLQIVVNRGIHILKDELCDCYLGGKDDWKTRLKRFLKRFKEEVIKGIISVDNFVKTAFEFTIKLFSGILDNLLQIFRSVIDGIKNIIKVIRNKNSTKEEKLKALIDAIAIGVGGVVWNSIDLALETALASTFIGPFAPFVAAILSGLGFGITVNYIMTSFKVIVDFFTDHHKEALIMISKTQDQVIRNAKLSEELILEARETFQKFASFYQSCNGNITKIQENSFKVEETNILDDVKKILNKE